MEPFIAALTAAALTLFDLDGTFFYVPSKAAAKWQLRIWWGGFIVLNGALSAALYTAASQTDALEGLPPWLRAMSIGAGYQALVRLKITTVQGVPVGFEALYEGAKRFFYKRINNIALAARRLETTELAGRRDLNDLSSEVKLMIDQNVLLTAQQKQDDKAWLLQTITDPNSSDIEKRRTVADYLLSGRRPGG
jgi:hypothetical protein